MDRRYKKRMDRYWEKMRKSAQRSFLDLEGSDWFDYWHCHIGLLGRGDKHPVNRASAIALGYDILKMADKFKASYASPPQSWWLICEKSDDDAVYFHSPNKNNTPYPCKFEGAIWHISDNELLNRLVNTTIYKIGYLQNEYGSSYVVTSET